MTVIEQDQTKRRVFIIFAAHALPYAEKCIESLFRNALEPLDVKLITDTSEDKKAILEVVNKVANPQKHQWQVIEQKEVDDRAEEQWKGLEHLKAFRFGHPCWRKLTDPLLYSQAGEEMIILDPDLYFPNQFTFEPTPEKTLLLMWQPPSCLLPPETVQAAFDASLKLAHHVDIGVAQWRQPIDVQWFDWLVGKLGGKNLTRIPHVEAIMWAALAMKMGGGYLNPERWLCWHRSHWKRVLLKVGVSGIDVLQRENFDAVKCFHACGMAKWWVKDASQTGLFDRNHRLNQPSEPIPFVEFTPQRYKTEQQLKGVLRKVGYYSLINPD